MISTAKVKNHYLDKIRELTNDGETTIQNLVIAHNDPFLCRKLSVALLNQSSAMLQLGQEQWNMEDEYLPEAILWAVEICQAKQVVLAGSSSAQVGPEDAVLFRSASEFDSRTTAPFERVKQVEAERQRSIVHFVKQLKALSENSELAQFVADGDLKINGLFYRAEIGTFTCYDWENESFAFMD